MIQSDRALKVQTFLDNYNAVTAINNQAWHGFLLGGPNGTPGLNDDLRLIFNLESGISNPQSWQLDLRVW